MAKKTWVKNQTQIATWVLLSWPSLSNFQHQELQLGHGV
jgi:hypothetical protein